MAALPGLVWPVAAHAQSLSEALILTYQNNPTIAAERNQLKATDEQLAQARANWWRPTVTGTVETGQEHYEQGLDTRATDGTVTPDDYAYLANVNTAEVTSTLDLWRGGQTSAAIRNARAAIAAEEATLESTQQSVLNQAAIAYANVVLQAALLGLDDEHETDLDQLRASIQKMLAGQSATVVDVAQVDVSLAQSRGDRAQTRGEIQAARSAFAETVGTYPGDLESWPGLPAIPDTLDEALAIARQESPTLAAARYEVDANEAAVDENAGALLPTISIVGDVLAESYKYNYSNSTTLSVNQHDTTASILLEVSIPLYDGGTTYSQVRESKRLVAQSRNKLAAAQLKVSNDVTSNWERLAAATDRIDIAYQQWQAAADAAAGIERQFEQGLVTLKNLLDAKDDVITARQTVEQAKYDAFAAQADLLLAMGRFDVASLGLGIEPWDTKAYQREMDSLPLGIGTQ